jgi:hypothetical protein
MLFVVSEYYIGFSARYDGTGNTDSASISIFRERDRAITHIISQINDIIRNDIDDAEDKDTAEEYLKMSNDEMTEMVVRLNEYRCYNFRNHMMYCLEEKEIQ